MASGGPRKGAGRKPGTLNNVLKVSTVTPTTRRAITDVLMDRVKHINVSPLEVMLIGMKTHYDDAKSAMKLWDSMPESDAKEHTRRIAKAELAESMQYAEKVAPYIHAKLQTTTIKGDKENPLEIALGLTSTDDLRKAIRGK